MIIIVSSQVVYGKADMSLDMFRFLDPTLGDMSMSTFFRKTIYFELKPKEFSKYTNIVYCFDGITWLSFSASFIFISVAFVLIEQSRAFTEKNSSSVSST